MADTHSHVPWPTSADELRRQQRQLAEARPPAWHPPAGPYAIGGCFVCFARGASRHDPREAPNHDPREAPKHDPRGMPQRDACGEPGWAGAAVAVDGRIVENVVVTGHADAAYEPGLLALREGLLLEAAIRALTQVPDVLLVNATARDHPRAAGLALHLGAILRLATVGVTHRPLLAAGVWPPDEPGARSPLVLGEETVGCWLRTRQHARPLAVHPGWRTDLDTACAVVLAAVRRARSPEPLREARRVARRARSGV
jgi:deoxyribonuclease V